jgi:hypothetical protein
LHDIFAAMIFQIKIGDHRSLFRTYPASFTTEEMIEVLDHLQFTHVLRQPDPQDAHKQLETKTITTFSMTRTMAKQLGQHFITARLVESASDPSGTRTMKDRGIWTVTSKGKWMVYNFAERGHVAWQEQSATRQALKSVMDRQVVLLDRCDFVSQHHESTASTLGHNSNSSSSSNYRLDGNSDGDSNKKDVDAISFERQNMTDAFRSMLEHLETSQLLADDVGGLGTQQMGNYTHTFFGYHVVEYIGQYMSVVNREEADMVASEFVLYGWISQVLDKSDRANNVKSDLLFKSQRNAIYALTDRGRTALGWDDQQQQQKQTPRLTPSSSGNNNNSNKKKSQQTHAVSDTASVMSSSSLASSSSSSSSISTSSTSPMTGQKQQRQSIAISTTNVAWLEPTNIDASAHSVSPTASTKAPPVFVPSPRTSTSSSHYVRLQPILEDPLLRMYFREFLKQNFCQENLHFWVDYRNMLYHHHHHQQNTNNGAATSTDNLTSSSTDYNRILSECYAMYVTYLAPQATMELNIDHSLHQDILRFVGETFKVLPSSSDSHPTSNIIEQHQKRHPHQQPLPFFYTPAHPTQEQQTIIMVSGQRTQCLKTLLAMYDRVHDQVCRTMAEDSLPRFLKSPRYIQWQQRQKERQEMELLEQQQQEEDEQAASPQHKDRKQSSSSTRSTPATSDLLKQQLGDENDDGYDSDNTLKKELDRLTLTGVATTTTTTTTQSPAGSLAKPSH